MKTFLRIPKCPALLLAALVWGWPARGAAAEAPADAPFQDDPVAHARYTKMVETMRQAKALSWVSDYRWESQGNTLGHATYRIWLKKPNQVRVEAGLAGNSETSGTLVGDGTNFWIFWSGDKPRYGWERSGKHGEEYEKHRRTFYMTEPSPLGRHSIGHLVGRLGAGMSMTILDPSVFHGYTDSLQPYLDGVRAAGQENVAGEECDLLEVSYMKHQRSCYLWLARSDHLPRKLKQIIRVSHDIIVEEAWSNVAIDLEIADDKFVWSPPAGWKEWRMPEMEEGLLPPGTLAPDFELTATDGRRIKLSNFRGQIVWLNKWRCG